MDFLEDMELYNQAMRNAYFIITKKKTLDDIYYDLEEGRIDSLPLPFDPVHEDGRTDDVIDVVNHVPDPFLCSYKQFVLIKNYSYELGALPSQWYDIFRRMRNFFAFRLVKIISGISSWVQDVPPFNVPDTSNYYYSSVDISEIDNKDCIVQCYIDDMKVEPAATQHISDDELKVWFPGHFVNQDVLPDVKVIIVG